MTAPRKGTKSRTIFLMCMRPQGATIGEITEAVGWGNSNLNAVLNRWLDMWGWDIRSFPIRVADQPSRKGRVAYKLIGKQLSYGKYRSFTIPSGD